jgi:geranylgeranyl pyrophosphate synthase
MTAVRQDAPSPITPTYAHLLRAARCMFQPDELERLVPRMRGGPRLADVNGQGTAVLDPIAATEAIAYDFLAKGGKYSRPFITLAAYDALTGGHCTQSDGSQHVGGRFNDVVRRAAVSIESFHKASLVHDDIQDDDAFRYGQPTLHVAHGVPTAINVGDYLIGLGYRLVSRDISEMGADAAADILNKLADAHTKLSEGQGAELVWRDSRDKRLSPEDALKIYALKTAPAFEAALYCGLRLAGPAKHYAEPAAHLARHLGIAFQILNDLQDWKGDNFNKLTLGGDVMGGRPTILWALALEGLQDDERRELERLVAEGAATPAVFAAIRGLFQHAGVFEKALKLVAEHRAIAERVADELAPDALRRLAHHLIESVLQQPAAASTREAGHPARRPIAVPAR